MHGFAAQVKVCSVSWTLPNGWFGLPNRLSNSFLFKFLFFCLIYNDKLQSTWTRGDVVLAAKPLTFGDI